MKDSLILIAHLLATIAKLLGPGGATAVVADSLDFEAATLDYQPQSAPSAATDRA